MGKEEFISFQGVVKKFGKRDVIKDLHLNIYKGDFVGILGISGSGKTTLLNMLVGFWKPTAGHISFKGHNIWKRQSLISSYFGFSSQAGSTYDNLTVLENLSYFGKLYNMSHSSITSRSKDLLELVELTGNEELLASELSTGMQRRLDIACAMLHNPDVLILDEPTKDLDPFLRKEILAMLKKINEEGTTIVMTSHLLTEIESVSDRVAILHNGSIVCCDSPESLKNRYSKEEEIQLRTLPGDYAKLAKDFKALKFNNIVIKSSGIIAYAENLNYLIPKICSIAKSNKEQIIEFKVAKPSLEEIFEAVTKR